MLEKWQLKKVLLKLREKRQGLCRILDLGHCETVFDRGSIEIEPLWERTRNIQRPSENHFTISQKMIWVWVNSYSNPFLLWVIHIHFNPAMTWGEPGTVPGCHDPSPFFHHEVPTGAADPVQRSGDGGGVTMGQVGWVNTYEITGLGKKHP